MLPATLLIGRADTIIGALGIATVKNLVEAGFDVTGFDSNSYVGGLWHYTDEDKTSVLPSKWSRSILIHDVADEPNSHRHKHFQGEGRCLAIYIFPSLRHTETWRRAAIPTFPFQTRILRIAPQHMYKSTLKATQSISTSTSVYA